MTKKLSQQVSGTESRILGALSRLDDFLQSPLIQGHCGTTPERSRITLGSNQGTNEEESRCKLHTEATISQSQNKRNTDPDDVSDMVTGIPKEITYCSPGTSSGTEEKPFCKSTAILQ